MADICMANDHFLLQSMIRSVNDIISPAGGLLNISVKCDIILYAVDPLCIHDCRVLLFFFAAKQSSHTYICNNTYSLHFEECALL